MYNTEIFAGERFYTGIDICGPVAPLCVFHGREISHFGYNPELQITEM